MHALKALWPGSTIKRWLGSNRTKLSRHPFRPVSVRSQSPVASSTPTAEAHPATPAPMNTEAHRYRRKTTSCVCLSNQYFDRLSPALQALASAEQVVNGQEIALQVDNILTQLPGGVVRISFGELRNAAPAGIFAEQNSHDYTLIDVPLSEILARINPDMLSLRADRKRVDVPEEVSGVFGKNGNWHGGCRAALKQFEPAKRDTEPAAAAPASIRPATSSGNTRRRARVSPYLLHLQAVT